MPAIDGKIACAADFIGNSGNVPAWHPPHGCWFSPKLLINHAFLPSGV
jgi:hypothetical protein